MWDTEFKCDLIIHTFDNGMCVVVDRDAGTVELQNRGSMTECYDIKDFSIPEFYEFLREVETDF
jgi:hypothetical protein